MSGHGRGPFHSLHLMRVPELPLPCRLDTNGLARKHVYRFNFVGCSWYWYSMLSMVLIYIYCKYFRKKKVVAFLLFCVHYPIYSNKLGVWQWSISLSCTSRHQCTTSFSLCVFFYRHIVLSFLWKKTKKQKQKQKKRIVLSCIGTSVAVAVSTSPRK
jgi:hypothetical protein